MAPSAGHDVELRSFGELQTQLRAMSYSEAVDMESVPLVRRLLGDLMAASSTREKTERALEKAQRDVLEFSQVLLPLRKENATLTRENNSLHLEIIHQEEAISEREKACELQLEGLRDDVKKLQFLNTQKAQQCAKKEQEVSKLQAQLERVLATGGGGPLNASQGFGSPSIEMRGSDASQSLRRLSIDSQQARKVQAEQQAQVAKDLQEQLTEMTTENKKLRVKCEQFDGKLSKREQEISRLSKLSVQVVNDQDRSSRKLHDLEERYQTKSKQEATELHVEQLNTQVDILNDQVAQYESRLKDATEQIRRNGGIAEKLQQAELDREHFVKELSVLKAKYHVLEEEHSRCGDTHQDPGTGNSPPTVDSPEAGDDGQAADVASLKEQVQTLTTHKDRLEDALRAMHYDKISYTNGLSNANSHNRVLTSDLARAEAKVKELNVDKSKLEQSLADARASLDAHSRELDVLRESLKQSEETHALDKEKNASLHRELRSLDNLLSQRDDECRSLNHALLIQKGEVERLTGQLDRLQVASNSEGEGGDNDGRKAVFAQEMKWLEEERHNLRSEKEELMHQVMNLEEDLQKAKRSLQVAEHEKEKLLEKADVAAKMQSNLDRMLETKKHECVDIQRQLAESKEKIRELSDKQNQAQVLLSRAEETENEKLVVQNEALALKRHVEELRDQNASLKNRVDNDDLYAKRLADQIQKLQTEAAVAGKTCAVVEKEKAELQNSYDSAMVELRNARQTWNHYQSEFEKLSNEVQAQQHSLSSGQNALQSSQSSVSDLRNQVRQLQSELKLKQNSSHQLETRFEQEKTSHKSAQTQLVLLQDELLQTKEVNRAREIALKQLRAEIQSKDRALTEKVEAVENFKLLIEQMESSRDQMVFQTKQRQQQIQRHQQEMDDLNTKVSSLESEISAKNNEISSLKKLTRTLDSEKDAVNDQLDVLTEKYHDVEKERGVLRKNMQAKKSDATGLQEQMGNLVNKLNEAEDKLRQMQDHCSQLESEVDRLDHLKGMHTAELAALAQDLENMTIENQAISEECTRLQRTELSHSQSTKNMKQTTREIERERDTLQIELEDLRHTYRSLTQEHEGMLKARAEISELQEELAVVNESLRKQVATLDNQLHTLREKNATLATEAATYRDQVSFLTEKLQGSEEKQDDLQTRMQHLVHELDAQKQVSTEISAQRYGAQAENAAVSQRIVHLEAKLSNCKYEMKSLQEKLHAEQSQRRSLEEVASTLRQKIATNESLISRLEEQRNAMAQEIQASHQRQVPASTAVMDMAELNHSPPSAGEASHASEPGKREHLPPPLSPSLSPSSNEAGSTPESGKRSSNGSSSFLPLHALEEAQVKCQELEDRLAQQGDTIQQLERSRSKFKRFAAKYEREIEQRDRKIEQLQTSSHASSSFVSPDARSFQLGRSHSSSSSSSSSSGRSRRHPVSSTQEMPAPSQ